MSLWMAILLLLGVVKLPIAALMLWLPFHNDEALRGGEAAASSNEDGGSAAFPAGSLLRQADYPSLHAAPQPRIRIIPPSDE